MFEKLKLMKERFAYLTDEISKPEVIADRELWQKLVKEHSDLETVIEKYDEYLAAEKSFEEAKELLSSGDDELKELAKAEFEEYKEKMEQLTGELKILLLPKDPNDGKNVVIEVRAGAGGEEAGLFGAELVRMYKRYAERHRWGVEDVTTNVTDLGGVKEVSFLVKGNGAYSKLKFESGVHRVQRVPETESQGRVHTSTATVAVLPEAEDVEVQIDEKDLKIDRFRSGGAGGQHV
ncbi:MAG: PCRF domain-containing protein, partial [Faecalibacterium sp.]|nr:PCRF domain-containing protein [Faecalibacterium sp.]